MGSALIIGGLLLGGLMLMGGGRSSSRSRRTPADVCTMPAARAAREQRTALFAWLECDGRTVRDAAALVRALREANRGADADACETRWNAIRDVAQSPPDGQVSDPAERDEAERASRGESGGSRMEMGPIQVGPNADEARRLVAPTVRALRRRSNYRRPLMDFQRAAAIAADGRYGGQSYNALRYYGGDPPEPFTSPAPSDPAAQYNPRAAS